MLAVVVALSPTATASAAPDANASACTAGSRDAAAEIADSTVVTDPVAAVTHDLFGAATIKLRYSAEAGCVWPWIGDGPPVVGAEVWIDHKRFDRPDLRPEVVLGGTHAVQLGNGNTYGPAYPLQPGVDAYRACGRNDGEPVCTLWFDGNRLFADDGGAGPTFVALGDSFSSGEGAPTAGEGYEPQTDTSFNLCHRSSSAFGARVARDLGAPFTSVACSGATTDDYWSPQDEREGQPAQRDLLNVNTQTVTLSMGGNDIGFADVAANCAIQKQLRLPITWDDGPDVQWAANCMEEIGGASGRIHGLLDDTNPHMTVTAMLRDIKARAPGARVLVMGYPRMFPETLSDQCATGFPGVSFQRKEMRAMNDLVRDLNNTLRLGVQQANTGAQFVDVTTAFTGHDGCAEPDANRWINRVHDLRQASTRHESFHPTVAGQEAFAARVLECHRDGRC
ncbi:SGNH/GDSL hydrolase family protein [Actinomycetospora sp. CA-101289]|uniref:SGNH/GDSL hydrolase family protein n=1 Tax=Actinomycetospora sp. CA-101289 TaxID=3239893 RepID=UPI003D96D587